MLVHHFLERSASRLTDKTALVFGENRLSYGFVNELSNRLAHGLKNLGITRGDRVAVFMDNSIESVISIFGVLKAGGVFSILSPTMKERKLSYILNHLEASVLITHTSRMPVVAGVSAASPSLKSVVVCGDLRGDPPAGVPFIAWDDLLQGAPTHNPKDTCIDIDLASIIYTSGTTADPKGIMMTHLNMVSAATSITTYLENTEDDIILNTLPLSFDYGLYQVLMCFLFGGTLVLEKSFIYPYVIIEKMIKEKVTGFPGVPTIFAMLLRLGNLDRYDLPHLRYFTSTGAVLPVNHIRRIREAFPKVAFYSMYGLSECKRVAYLPPHEIDRRPESVGIAIPNTEVFIVDEEGRPVGPGITGELVVRGSHVMKGYWKDPAETAKRLKPGILPNETILYTGDLFRMDEDGFLFFVARKDDIIKTRGERVSPREVENVLNEIPGVSEAVVVPVPDEILGNAIKAFIVKDKQMELSAKDVQAYCARNLESFMVPKYVAFVDAFPRTGSGKIDKKALMAKP